MRITRFLKRIQRTCQGELDYYFKPGLRSTNHRWGKKAGQKIGGSFNGQHFRQKIFLELMRHFDCAAIIETGTFRGATTAFMLEATGKQIFTIEGFPRNFGFSRARFRGSGLVRGLLGDSRKVLRELAADAAVPKANVFFYLDAHWEEDLPLREEIGIISRHWRDSIVMIDDFEVPGDPGYTFDDYGPDKRLSLDYLMPLQEFDAYFPTLPSAEESGHKRGSVVLASTSLAGRMRELAVLRPAAVPSRA